MVKIARDLTAAVTRHPHKRMKGIVKFFDYADRRWEDEKAYEDFEDYVKEAKKVLRRRQFFLSEFTPDPMRLVFHDEIGTYTMYIKGNRVVVDTKWNPGVTQEDLDAMG